MLKLTRQQREILTLLKRGDELVHNSGQWWVDEANIRTSGKLVNFFLRNILISATSSNAGKSEYYHISEAGQRLLDGKTKIYRSANGKYYESLPLLAKGEGLKW
jgi:hypothetical protein